MYEDIWVGIESLVLSWNPINYAKINEILQIWAPFYMIVQPFS